MTAPDLNARLGAAIRQRRVKLGLTQQALAGRLGITFQHLQKYEHGKSQVSFARLVDLARALEISVIDLISAAIGEEADSREGVSDREMLEMIKRFAGLNRDQQQCVKLLVLHLAKAL